MANLKEEEIKTLQMGWGAASAKLYYDLAEGERALLELGQEMDEIMGEDWLLMKSLREKSTRWSLESGKSPKGVDMEQEYFKCRDACNPDDIFGEKRSSRRKKSFGVSPRVSIMAEEKLKLEASVAHLEQELENHKQRLEQTQKELNRLERENLALQEEMEALNASEILEENVDLKVELQQLRVKFHEQNEATESTILALEVANHKLDSEVKMFAQKLASTHVVEEELRRKESFLQVELENKVQRILELDLQAMSMAESYTEELRLKAMRITDLEASYQEKCEALATLAATCDAVGRERDKTRVNAEHLQAEGISSSTQLQELREIFYLKSTELEALQKQLLSLTTSLQQSRDELGECKIKEAGLLAELLGLKQELSRSESNVDVTRGAEIRLQEELVAMNELLKNTQLEKDRFREELATVQVLVLEHQNAVSTAQQASSLLMVVISYFHFCSWK